MKQPCAVWCRDAWNDATEEESSSYKHMPKVCPPEVGSGEDLHMSGTQLNFNGYPSCTVGWCDRDQRIFNSFACRHCQFVTSPLTTDHFLPSEILKIFPNIYFFFSFLFGNQYSLTYSITVKTCVTLSDIRPVEDLYLIKKNPLLIKLLKII